MALISEDQLRSIFEALITEYTGLDPEEFEDIYNGFVAQYRQNENENTKKKGRLKKAYAKHRAKKAMRKYIKRQLAKKAAKKTATTAAKAGVRAGVGAGGAAAASAAAAPTAGASILIWIASWALVGLGIQLLKFIRHPIEQTKLWTKRAVYASIIWIAAVVFFIFLSLSMFQHILFLLTGNVQQIRLASQDSALQISIIGPPTAQNGQELSYTVTLSYSKAFNDIALEHFIPEGTQYIFGSATHIILCDGQPCTPSNAPTTRRLVWSAKSNNITTAPVSISYQLKLRAVNVPANIKLAHRIVALATDPQPIVSCGQKSTMPAGAAAVGDLCSSANKASNLNVSTKLNPSGYYQRTYFGCSDGQTDPNDNCRPACPGITESEESIRWFAANADQFATPGQSWTTGCNKRIKVTNPTTGEAVVVRIIDRGPNCSTQGTNAKIDISFAASRVIGQSQFVQVEQVSDTTPLGPIKSCTAP